MRFWWHIISAYALRYKLLFISGLFILFLTIYAINFLWPRLSRSNVVTVGFIGVYTLDTIPSDILALVTQSLIKADLSGKPIPSLASHWTVLDDGKKYIVFLRDNLKWHDLSNLDAKDISIAISDVSITALNNKAIEFKLPNPISSFPLSLDKPIFKSKSFYGTGEYRIVNIEKTGEIVKLLSLAPKNKNLPRVEIRFYSNEKQALNAIKIGEIKTATLANAKVFESWPNLKVERKTDETELISIFYNNNDPNLSSKEFIQ